MSSTQQLPIKEGFIHKKSRFFGVWKKRWAVLTNTNNQSVYTLSTYKKERIYQSPTESIRIDNNTIVKPDYTNTQFSIENKIDKDKFTFKAASKIKRNLWVQSLSIQSTTTATPTPTPKPDDHDNKNDDNNNNINDNINDNPNDNIFSLSDDDDDDDDDVDEMVNDSETWLSVVQTEYLMSHGYCSLDTKMDCEEILFLATGYIRRNFIDSKYVIKELIIQIATYYGGRYNDRIYVQFVSSEDLISLQGHYLLTRRAASLSNLYKSILNGKKDTVIVPIKKVRKDILECVCQYLGHHKGKRPEAIAKPIRSVKMERICADKWDADFINKFPKKTIFQIILAANYMDIPSLLHLGCAKIATLIKGKSPEEIKNILADDGANNDDNDDNDNNNNNNTKENANKNVNNDQET